MYSITSPIGTKISVPETAQENSASFAIGEMAAILEYYEKNGYVIVRNTVPGELCDKIRKAFADTVKKYPGHIYRQTTQNPEKNKFSEFGYVMNPILNLQSLRSEEFASLRDLAMTAFSGDTVKSVHKGIYKEPSKLVQSMYFEGNSETWPHQDTYYLDSEHIGAMIACWYALEDIGPGAGRFFVVPGSHKIDMVKNGKDFDVAFNHGKYKDLVRKILSEGTSEIRAPIMNKGDVMFWNAKTIHGSLRTTTPEFSRSSLTAHYIPASHKFLQFQSRIKPLKIREYNGMEFHCPKDMDRISNRVVMSVETSFPKTFQMTKKLAIKALVG
jgi:phytanoyl-CoA hydroxylase